jgi:hypothetical protein
MAHLPVNHPARPLLRALAAAAGLYVLGFGVVGFVETLGLPFFDRGEHYALGLLTNPAFSLLSVAAGPVLLAGALYGRNVDHFINLAGSVVFLVSGIVMLAVQRTDANLLNFAVRNCVVSFLIGLALLLAGMYGKVGPPEEAAAEREFRQGTPGRSGPGRGP